LTGHMTVPCQHFSNYNLPINNYNVPYQHICNYNHCKLFTCETCVFPYVRTSKNGPQQSCFRWILLLITFVSYTYVYLILLLIILCITFCLLRFNTISNFYTLLDCLQSITISCWLLLGAGFEIENFGAKMFCNSCFVPFPSLTLINWVENVYTPLPRFPTRLCHR